MLTGDSAAPSFRKALAQLQGARTDVMALRRGSKVEEWNALDRAQNAIDEAIAEVRRVMEARK
jgi:signal transduction histidine kinase